MVRRRVLLIGVPALIILVGLLVRSGVLHMRGEPVKFHNGSDTLTGMLVFPRWKQGPFPAAIVVHGSGRVRWQDLKSYARHLVPEGMAVLLFDKRGVGGSSGTHRVISVADSGEQLELLAEDVAAAVEFLALHDLIDADRIGLIGGSQAGWIMPLAASKSDHVAFLVTISGPAVSYGQEIYYSQMTGDDPGIDEELADSEITRRMQSFTGPNGYDPEPVLRQLSVPSLWLLGSADRSVPTSLSVRTLEHLRQNNNRPIDIQVYPDGDHSLRHAGTGRRIDYWPRVHQWLAEQGILRQ